MAAVTPRDYNQCEACFSVFLPNRQVYIADYLANGERSASAVEVSKSACDFLKTAGINLNFTDTANIWETNNSIVESHDCIVATHILEHVSNPIQVLKAAVDTLKPGGTLVVAMSNPLSMEAECFWEYWYDVEAPRYQTLLTYDTLLEIAKNWGLEQVAVSWSDLHTRIKYGVMRVLKWVRQKVSKHNLSNSYTIVFRKNADF